MKRYSLLVLSITAILLLVACAGPAPTPSASPTVTPVPATPTDIPALAVKPATAVRVVVPVRDNLQWLNFWIALGAGFFKEEGLDVEVVIPPNPFGTPQFLLQGRADVAVLQPPLYLGLIGQGQPILVFANLLQNDPINLIVRKEVAEARKLSPTAPLVERLKGMHGLKVGIAPNPSPRLRTLFATAGMDIDKDIQVVTILGEEQNQAFAENEVDALYSHTPYLERALVEQGAVLLVNQSRGEVPELANLQIHTLVTMKSFAAASPQVLAGLTRAIYQAQKLVHADQKAAVDALFRSGVEGLERKKVETIVAIYEPAIPETPEVSIKGMEQGLSFYPVFGPRPDLTTVNLADYVAPQFARQAVEGSR